MKLEAGKTYVFKDDAARDEYLKQSGNRAVFDKNYNDGFSIGFISDYGGIGFRVDDLLISFDEIELFEESKPFDISEYESETLYIDTDVDGVNLKVSGTATADDVKMMVKHFKLI